MISRRSIRVKVMQTIFAHEIVHEEGLEFATKMMQENVEKTIEINLVFLMYFKEIARYVQVYAEQQRSKYLLTAEEKNVNENIAKSPIISYIHDSVVFNKLVKKYRIEDHLEPAIVKEYFFLLFESEVYKNYITKANPSLEDDKEVLTHLVKKILNKQESLLNHLEAYFLNVHDDTDLVCFSLKRSIKNFSVENATNFELGISDWEEEKEYAFNLLKVTLNQSKEYDAMIEPKLKGWELDRISKIDIIIIKLAISEMLHFPNIPLKVTMNEYIDLCKLYSTPKSKEFVNGILDRIMKELAENNRILKSGRGLTE